MVRLLSRLATALCCVAVVSLTTLLTGSAPEVRAASVASARLEGATTTIAYPLRNHDATLDGQLERVLRARGWDRLVAQGDLAVALVDLSSAPMRYAGVNDDRMIYAASLPKIAILLGAFDALEDGRLQWSPALRDELVDMIRVSSNTAATAVLQKVGFESIARALRQSPYRLFEPERGGLWVGKAYGRDDYWRRDPVANTSHGATARQAARFFVLLQKGMLVSPEASEQMKEILGDPGIHHKFVKGLGPHDVDIYRKSGTWRDFHSDAALVEDHGRTYVAVGLARHANGSRLLEELIVELDGLIHAAPAAAN